MRPGMLLLAAVAALSPIAAPPAAAGAQQLTWEMLRPADQPGWVPGAPASPAAVRQGEVLAQPLDGETVSLSGYLLPVDREGDLVYEFLLVPTPGGCSHMARPPANQVVRVSMPAPYRLREIYEPVSVSGTLRTDLEQTQLEIIDGVTVIESGYALGGAQVAAADLGPRRPIPGVDTPWSFLRN